MPCKMYTLPSGIHTGVVLISLGTVLYTSGMDHGAEQVGNTVPGTGWGKYSLRRNVRQGCKGPWIRTCFYCSHPGLLSAATCKAVVIVPEQAPQSHLLCIGRHIASTPAPAKP